MKERENLSNKVKGSLIWSFSDQLVSQVIFIAFGIYLARILEPSVFGVIGMVSVFTNFAVLFVDMGFGAALVQKKDADQSHYSSVFWLNIFIGIGLYSIFYLIAPYLSSFYKEPTLIPIVRVMSLSFIITSLISVQSNLLVKSLDFKKKVIFNWTATGLGYLVAFLMAYNGYGVWALVAMTLITSMINTILYWVTSKWKPSFLFSITKIKDLSGFGLNYLGDNTINYWSRNFDNFIIGRVLGSGELGIYSRAYSLMMLPLRNITSVFSRVLFPVFARWQDDISLIKTQYLRVIKLVGFVTFPLLIGLACLSKEFVLLFFGDQWKGMIPLLRMLCLLGTIQSLVSLNGVIYNSLGKTNIAFRVTLVVNAILIITFLLSVSHGIYYLTLSYLIVGVIISFPIYHVALRLISCNLIEVFKQLKGILVIVSVMAVALLGVDLILSSKISLLLLFIIKVLIGFFIYIGLTMFFERKIFEELKNIIKRNGK
jgi:O-antigen/teichoic acid export membrane protein